MEARITDSRKTLARIGGLLYLMLAVFGAFAESVRSSVRVPGDAAATAANVTAHITLLHFAFAADLSDFTLLLVVGVIMFAIFAPIDRTVAVAMLTTNAVSVALQTLNMIEHIGALLIATDPRYTAGLSPATVHALVLFLLDLQHLGYVIAQIFFGLWLLPLGWLVYRSGWFPAAVGVVLAIACFAYLGGVVVTFLSPTFQSPLALPFGLVAGLAELSFVLWILVVGLRQPDTRQPHQPA